jgi:hypothetical protein
MLWGTEGVFILMHVFHAMAFYKGDIASRIRSWLLEEIYMTIKK